MAKKINDNSRVELKDSGVLFNEEEHTYLFGDKYLSGITGMLQRQFAPDEYKDIDPAVLNAAAAYGTDVHKAIELWDVEWDMDFAHETEIEDYKCICRDEGLAHEKSEYCVTDKRHWASNIDKVYRVDDNTFNLGDIKTYGDLSAKKKEMARWQLSIYAYLFELQNPKAKVDKLFILHLRNKMKRSGEYDHQAEIVYLNRIPSEICKDLLAADEAGEQFKNPYAIPDKYKQMEVRIAELVKMKNDAETELAAIKAEILADMEEKDQKVWATDTMRLTRKYASIRAGFDMKKFRADHSEIDYSPYETQTKVASSLVIML